MIDWPKKIITKIPPHSGFSVGEVLVLMEGADENNLCNRYHVIHEDNSCMLSKEFIQQEVDLRHFIIVES